MLINFDKVKSIIIKSDYRYIIRSICIYLASICRRKKRAHLKSKHGVDIPASLFIYITHECNLKCQGCISSGYDKNSMTPSTIAKIFDEAHAMGVNSLNILGGEPLISPYFESVLFGAQKYKHININLVTNATLITKEKIADLKQHPNIILYISIDGDERLHNQRRGRFQFGIVAQKAEILRRAKIPFFVITTVDKNNFKCVTSLHFARLCNEVGALGLILLPFLPVDKDSLQSSSLSYNLIQAMGVKINAVNNLLPGFHVFDVFGMEHKFGGCRAGDRSLTINADSSIQPCPAIMLATSFFKDSIVDSLKSPYMKQIVQLKQIYGNQCLILNQKDTLQRLAKDKALGAWYTSDSGKAIVENGFSKKRDS